MKKIRYASLVLSALFEIVRYEVVLSLYGVGRILLKLNRPTESPKSLSREHERDICNAVLLATCLHWKPVLCLQHSVCTVRLLKRHGIDARVVIGYRSAPLFFHAWVEVNDRVIYGSPTYKQRLRTLFVS